MARSPAKPGYHTVARLYISPPLSAADGVVKAVEGIGFLEAKRRAAVVQRIMRTAGANVVAFPIMRRCRGGARPARSRP
jgi:hypothetical protein